ncbi:MAG TPA: sugar ABC transporter permease [Anaerolineae bacterium]|nr:sugar ABC transporter permease [Anaerolineae bacterium]
MSTRTQAFPQARSLHWWQKYRNQALIVSFLFVLPALINFAVFRYYPMLWAGWASLWQYSLLGGFTKFVGLDNYLKALGDSGFYNSLRVTLYFTILKVPLQVILALALAVFANQPRRGMGVMRAFIFIPVVTSFVVVSIVWGMILNRDVGLLNAILQSIGLPRLSYLTSPTNALPAIVVISIWKDIGYSVIILAAGLKGISQTYYEAAIVDGASPWQRFRYITVPMLRRALMFVIVTTTIFSFQVFIPVYQLTQGGPGQATNVIVYNVYKQAFVFGAMGYASAISIMLLIIMLLISVVQMRLLRSHD